MRFAQTYSLALSGALLMLLAWSAYGVPSRVVDEHLWVLKPVVRPNVPATSSASQNPIDAFIAAEYQRRGLRPAPQADKRTLLRRIYLDLIGIPPTPDEQQAFVDDPSPDAYEKVVDRLLASNQHGVRYARHWLDVLRYSDADERMVAAPGLYLWRDWVINALNDDLPYDQFVRAQLTGRRSAVRTQMTATGVRVPIEPRPDDMFALGFLSRGQVIRDGKDHGELAITAVETVSTAFMGLTVGCAKCHDHMYDPIKKRDFYAMKALFDPLVVKKVILASPADVVEAGRAQDELDRRRAACQKPIDELIEPYRKKLYDDRVAMLPADVRAIIQKPQQSRSAAEQKIADDYYPVLRIDSDKLTAAMPEQVRRKYDELQRQLNDAGAGLKRPALPAFWTVESDPKKELEKCYELTSGDADRPELDHEVQPGWPFAPKDIDFREGRREAFSEWLTAEENPVFARVAVNRLWQWHFGEGLQKLSSDFGHLGGEPSNPALLDWLAAEFVARGYDMKQMSKLMVMSDTYKMASAVDPAIAAADMKIDPADSFLWHYRLERLEAEPIWDSILSASGDLDLSVGGPSFDISGGGRGRRARTSTNRRAAYIVRGYSTERDVTPAFLQTFDVDDGRTPCPMRTQTVTAPQALFMMNSPQIDAAAQKFADRLRQKCGGDLPAAVDLGYRITLARPPSPAEAKAALEYLDGKPERLKGFAWLLFNLDEFIYSK
ncbi:MAG TPA: DUF1549 and DUF1553 domain-containing protein [Tepidisphaeraceae bacterium]|jgi:hypothetical protein|nr:DUF1549 and DUF1553 domain-containing protein [Tepidisphaeraceae bacterium]